jgi:hypothetical protein
VCDCVDLQNASSTIIASRRREDSRASSSHREAARGPGSQNGFILCHHQIKIQKSEMK